MISKAQAIRARARLPLLALALAACAQSPTGSSGAPSASAGAPTSAGALAAAPGPAERLRALLAAEHRRAPADVTQSDQQHRDVTVRRAAARALARIGGDPSRPGLLHALSDEDPDVIAWGAYGLGFSCKDHESETVAALVARALAIDLRQDSAPDPAPRGPSPAAVLDPAAAIARAIGRCGAATSEPTLVAWLAAPRERALHAAYALGDLAALKQRLREETLVALLNLAEGSAAAPPLPEALHPIGRLEHVPLSVIDRIRDVATARLAEAGDARIFAVRALGRAGEPAAAELARVVTSAGVFSASERAEAARALKRLDRTGQRALARALPSLVPSADPVALSALVGDDLGVLLTVLSVLEPARAAPARKALRDLATLAPPPSAPPPIARRLSWIRCGAAALLAGKDFRDPLLLACDVTTTPEPAPAPAADAGAPPPAPHPQKADLPRGSIGARAVVQVIARAPIKGSRYIAYRALAETGDRRAREAALELIAGHDEIDGAAALLAKALESDEPGLIGTAAEVITKQPQRASDRARPRRRRRKKPDTTTVNAPSPAIVTALLALLTRPGATDDPEQIDAVIDAVGALALKKAAPRLDELCKSSYPTTRAHAEKALGILRGRAATCAAPPAGEAPPELSAPASAPVTLVLDTDAGEVTITLDPTLAPIATTRVVDLVRAGYYDGMVVHRVVPGFVTQFGAPFGDGYGGPPGKQALRCETTPLPFEPLRVGVALSGRDTGSSQLFVMHARAPHLDGQYALVGTASGPWASFVDGDIIRKATVRE